MNGTSMAIQIEGVSKKFGTYTVLDGLSLHVGYGEIYGFLGLNGAGKTTTIRMLLAMLKPNTGSLYMMGEKVDAGNYKLWGNVGYLEEAAFYPHLTVAENLEIARRMQGIADKASIPRIMSTLKLDRYTHKKAKHLSQGNKQRLGLAKALIHNPKILILDEPINGLDPAGIAEIRDLIRNLSANFGITVFMSSHILEELSKLATRIGIIHEGRLIEEVMADKLERQLEKCLMLDGKDRESIKHILSDNGYVFEPDPRGYIRLDDECAVQNPERLVELLVRSGQTPAMVNVITEDLESYFLRKISGSKVRP
ncbi:MAG: ABC transporter ATP-binding protein [Treponema sp.]|jgi:ABC-2 type transport system ATP-binding protein|nr:ABC transporter ATP-binding protein [Treponema sp.]